jgi:hypothetical protein
MHMRPLRSTRLSPSAWTASNASYLVRSAEGAGFGGQPAAHATEEQLKALAASGIPVGPTLGGFTTKADGGEVVGGTSAAARRCRHHARESCRDANVDSAADDDIRDFRRRRREQRHHLGVERLQRKLGGHREPDRGTQQFGEVNTKHDADQRQQWGRVGAAPTNGRNSRKARPMVMVPAANFSGVAGWRWPSCVQMAANTPERTMMNTGLIDCTQGTGIFEPTDEPVQALVGVVSEHRELLLVERPERDAGDEQRDERDRPGALRVGDVSAGDDDDEVGDRSRNVPDDDQQREVARVDQAREHTL